MPNTQASQSEYFFNKGKGQHFLHAGRQGAPFFSKNSSPPGVNRKPISPNLESKLDASKGAGSSLPQDTKTKMEDSFGTDFSGVRIHNDGSAAKMNNDLNAQAFTHGNDIYFNEGKYDNESNTGQHLLAHELTHVVQQNGSIHRKDLLQRTLAETLPVSNGEFGVNMATQTFATNKRTGLTGSIEFTPAETSPYSNEIVLIQIVKDINTDTGGRASLATNVGTTGIEPLFTQDNPFTGVEGDFATDVTNNQPGLFQGNELSPEYDLWTVNQAPDGSHVLPGAHITHGFKRSNDKTDIKGIKMEDCPGTVSNTANRDFKFETAAKATDSNIVYGSLQWGFKIRAGTVTDEYARALDNQSATFDEAFTRHQDFYVHEPVVFYFNFDKDMLVPDEKGKLSKEITDYLQRFPDVGINISAYADIKGGKTYNQGLASRRG